ncbi:MAG: NADH-quinone oxidoreductase subunit H [Candidatus Moduliflexus flocculans]|nr:NADH-quinone oxidoreductase subunit H [Candidatus Moduliflexus flocculans]
MPTDALIVLVKIVLTMTWTLLLALFLTWVERKESAVMQDRIGANRASVFGLRLFGLFQPFADAIKMFFKEDFDPKFSQRVLHWLAPTVSFFCVAVTMVAVPFGDTIRLFGRSIPLQVVDLDAALLYILAMLSLGIYGILISGWASANRFALIGSLRGAAQLISYEVALGLSLVGLVMVFPSLRLSALVEYQGAALRLPAPLGHFPPAPRLRRLLPGRHGRDEAGALRHAGGRIGDHRLLHRVRRPQVRAVHVHRFPRGHRSRLSRDDPVLRRLAGALARRRRLRLPRGRTMVARALGRHGPPGPVLQPQGLLLLLAPDPGPLDLSAFSLRPGHGLRLEGPRSPRRRQHPGHGAHPGGEVGRPCRTPRAS